MSHRNAPASCLPGAWLWAMAAERDNMRAKRLSTIAELAGQADWLELANEAQAEAQRLHDTAAALRTCLRLLKDAGRAATVPRPEPPAAAAPAAPPPPLPPVDDRDLRAWTSWSG